MQYRIITVKYFAISYDIQGYHRDVLESRGIHPPITVVHSPPPIIDKQPKKTLPEISAENTYAPPKGIPAKRGRDRKSKRHRKVAAGGSKDISLS